MGTGVTVTSPGLQEGFLSLSAARLSSFSYLVYLHVGMYIGIKMNPHWHQAIVLLARVE